MYRTHLFLFIVLSLGTATVTAETPSLAQPLPQHVIFSPEKPLTDKERIAVRKAQQWINANNYPFRSGDTITYLYGTGQPVAVCAPLQLCTVKLGDGEKVSPNGIHLGDTARWQVSPSVGGKDSTFLIIKPVDVGLNTSLVVVTDRRSYSIKLISRLNDLTPVINFHHPDDIAKQWTDYYQAIEDKKTAARLAAEKAAAQRQQAQQQALERQRQAQHERKMAAEKARLDAQRQQLAVQQAKARLEAERRRQWQLQQQQLAAENNRKQQALEAERARQQQAQQQVIEKQKQAQQQAQAAKEQRTIPQTRHDIAQLDFNYHISDCRQCPWRPVRVYNNGAQTVIQMGPGMQATEAPSLLVLGQSGEQQLVNYRVNGDTYLVDQVFHSAVLVAGVGRQQQKVVITRAPARQRYVVFQPGELDREK